MSSTSTASSVPSSTTVYLITGASRGIGYGLIERLAARPDTLVYAGARDPAKANALQQLAKQHSSSVRVVQLSVESDSDHAAAVKQVQAEAGRVDVVLANAGIAAIDALERTGSIAIEKLREHFEVNTVGPVRLFNHFLPLLERSSAPKYVVVSSISSSLAYQPGMAAVPVATYGASKAATNFITQRIHLEHPAITAFPLHPGFVATDMGNAGAVSMGLSEAPDSIELSATSVLKLLDEATRETHGGQCWDAIKGEVIPW